MESASRTPSSTLEWVVFSIKGYDYRLVVSIDYEKGIVRIRWIGTRTRVAEVMNRKRGLSIEMIRRLHEHRGISAEVLIRPTRSPSSKPSDVLR